MNKKIIFLLKNIKHRETAEYQFLKRFYKQIREIKIEENKTVYILQDGGIFGFTGKIKQ